MSHSLMTPDWEYRGFVVGRDWDRDTWEWCVGGCMQIPSGGILSVSSDWFPVEKEDELWEKTVADIEKQIDSLMEDLTKPHIVAPSKHDGFDAYFSYKGPNPCFHWEKENVIKSLEPLLTSIDPTTLIVDGVSVSVHQKWDYYYKVDDQRNLIDCNHDITETNSHPEVLMTTIHGRLRDKQFKIVYPYGHSRDVIMRIYVHDASEGALADSVAKVFDLYGAKEAILNQIESEQIEKEQ